MNNKKQTTEERRAIFEKAALKVKERLEANKDKIAEVINEIKEEWTVKEAGKPDFTFTITTIEDDENAETN